MSDNCIFCKIIKGEIPSSLVYEDEHFKVILDKFPSVLGHTLIIPKVHADNIFDLSEDAAKNIFVVAQKIAQAMKQTLEPDGINILQNNGAAAGQSVGHFHMHIIPRYKGDSTRISWNPEEADAEGLEKTTALLKAGL